MKRVLLRGWLSGALISGLAGCGAQTPAASTGASQPTASAVAQASSTAAPDQPTAAPASGRKVEAHGVSFTLPFADINAETVQVPEAVAKADEPSSAQNPAATRFTLSPFFPDLFATQPARADAEITIYKTADFPRFGAEEFGFADQLEDLQQLLKDRPDLGSQPVLPFVPFRPADQVLHAQGHYLDFTNGSGVVYLTYYAQDASLIPRAGLFYTFQGLANDGKHYISATFPVSAEALPTSAADEQQALTDYQSYLTSVKQALGGADPAADFTPALPELDQLLRSLNVQE